MKFASTLPEVARMKSRWDRYSLAFVGIGIALVGLVAYIVLDLHNAQEEAQQICEQSVSGLDLVGEMQYQVQESRRSMLYALATTDPNQQVQYADQSRTSSTEVARLFMESHEMPLAPRLRPTIRTLETEWSRYLTNRDEVIAAILEGDPRRGVQLDLGTGVPTFNQVREALQTLRHHFNEEAQNRLGEVNHLFEVSMWKFGLSLCLTVIFAAFAVKLVQRDRMLKVIQASENRLNEVVRSINEGMMVVNPAGSIELWNQAAAHSTGLRADVVLGRSLSRVFPASASAALEQGIAQCSSTRLSSTISGLTLTTESHRRIYEARVFPFEHGATVFFNDVTNSADALRELKTARDNADNAARSANERLLSLACSLESAVNEFEATYSPPTATVATITSAGCKPSNDDLGALNRFLEATRSLASEAREMRPVNPADAAKAATGHTFQRVDSQKESGALMETEIARALEVQSQKILEDIAHLTRVASTGELAASIAHELNQPLTAILANSQATRRFLKKEPVDIEEIRAALEDVIADSQRAGEVIRRLRRLFKRSRLERHPIDVNELVWDTVRLLKTEMQLQNVVTRMDLSAGLPPIAGDRVQLQQVILNLMLNAIDVLSSLSQTSRLIHIASVAEDERIVRITIKDNGPGLDETLLPQLFMPFFTTKKDGMGMGLSVAKSIVEGHGGKLWATNNSGGGAAFHFLIPTSERPATK